MLIAEDELYRLPDHFLRPKSGNVGVCLWQHQLTREQLIDYAEMHQPGLVDDVARTLLPRQTKRLVERLSVALLLTKTMGAQARVAYHDSGRPYLMGGLEPAEISISHTHEVYALSLSKERHGMDVEQWRDLAYKLRDRFLHPDEQTFLPELANRVGGLERAATLLWSAKESLYKAEDAEGVDFREEINLRLHPTEHRLIGRIREGLPWNVNYHPYPTCVLTYAQRPEGIAVGESPLHAPI